MDKLAELVTPQLEAAKESLAKVSEQPSGPDHTDSWELPDLWAQVVGGSTPTDHPGVVDPVQSPVFGSLTEHEKASRNEADYVARGILAKTIQEHRALTDY